jgi:hypothetical protein
MKLGPPSSIALLCLAGTSFFTLATSRVPEQKNLPQIKLREERLGPNGPVCGEKELTEVKGPIPTQARQVVKMHVFSDKPTTWKDLAGALKHRAQIFCVDGLSYLKAEVSDGHPGYTDIHAVGWVDPTPQENPLP